MAEIYPQADTDVNEIEQISIQLASPDVIRSWSYGEVIKPETINYRSFKPEKDGLFCEKIFGPVKNWECNCGKYKRIRYRGVVCDRCGVEVTHSKVRRERMGHIELAVPVVHIWFYKAMPSKLSALIDISVNNLERIIYYESYLVLDPGDTDLKKWQLLSEEECVELEDAGKKFTAMMGGPAIKAALVEIDLDEMSIDLRSKIKLESSEQRKSDHLRRLRVLESLRNSNNRPEWMVLDVLPVLPPDLRPLVPLEGGRFATSDLNDLYRRVVNRNNRLKKLVDINAPDVILRNEKRMLQEAVDVLFDNGRRTFSLKGEGKRPLKSLSEMLKGKQGRFRQNLLGKRVDYSGRSVVVVGPELKLHQCGLPKVMALELFKPFVISELEKRGLVQTVKGAKKFIERERPEVWDVLEETIKDHPVFLNRAPTLHRLGIQAFFPVLVEGKAIRLHPLVCTAFNADFDGDQMAVHVPLSYEAQMEARLLMLSSNNILHPASGLPVVAPTQDIVLGCYYLSKTKMNQPGEGKVFADQEEVVLAVANNAVALHSKIKLRVNGKIIETTPGRVVINEALPKEIEFINETLKKSKLTEVVSKIYKEHGKQKTVEVLDALKELGFEYSARGGITIGIDDMIVPEAKHDMVVNAQSDVAAIQRQHARGIITDSERYNKIIDVWTHTTNDVAASLYESLALDRNGFNPIFMMSESGARGSKDQIKQLAGMRGLMQKPQKKLTGRETIENPIISNFREGLTVLEYFISTHGARKGLADTALKTADAGYLTRRLVSVAGDLVINADDCGTILGIEMTALKEGDDIIEPLCNRVLGRVAQEDIYDPISDALICAANEEIDEEKARKIEEAEIESVKIRSVLTCEMSDGVCRKCYGRDLATGKKTHMGEAVGVVAAQAIGEPGTQLTLRTFHMGGTAGRIAARSKEDARRDGTVQYEKITFVKKGDNNIVTGRNGEMYVIDVKGRIVGKYNVPYGSMLRVGDGEKVKKGMTLVEWDPYNSVIVSDRKGEIKFLDIYSDEEAKKHGFKTGTLREEVDEQTGLLNKVIVDHRERVLHPRVLIADSKGKKIANFPIPTGAYLQVIDGARVDAGEVLVKIPHESTKTRDITGGLPRVAELFEARKPKEPAIVAEIDGIVEFGEGIERGMRKITIRDEHGEAREYLVPLGKHLHVHQGDRLQAGERLVEGPINPHDILRISGEKAVQKYLVNEIQQVYKLQGVTINDKHIECIVRQMLQKVHIEEEGDTSFLERELVSKAMLREENEKIVQDGGTPATFKPVLLGITKASLSTDSFLSSASFQETTKVLTNAAISGKIDKLKGLRENVIIGGLVSCGTGSSAYRKLKIRDLEEDVIPGEEFEKESFVAEHGPVVSMPSKDENAEILPI